MGTQTRQHRRSNCPIAYTTDIIGDKWTILIVRDILFKGKSSFGDFENSDEGISTNILTDRLKRLERQGIITKEQDQNHLSKYIYSLTNKGLDLLPVIIEMVVFAGKYDEKAETPQVFLPKIDRDRNKTIQEIRERYVQQRGEQKQKNR